MKHRRPPARRRAAAPGPALRILYEDQSLIVVDKPAGLPSVSPRRLGRPSAWSTLRHMLEERARAGEAASGEEPRDPGAASAMPGPPREGRHGRVARGARVPSRVRTSARARGRWQTPEVELYLIHRLDQPASGLLVFARTARARDGLKKLLASRLISRRYAAVVEGLPRQEQREIRSKLVELEGPTHPVRSLRPGDGGPRRTEAKLAVTRYRLIGTHAGRSALEVELETGRKHQIRVHLAEAGHPVAGDRLYGRRGSAPIAKAGPRAEPGTGERSAAVRSRPAGARMSGRGEGGPAGRRNPGRLLLHAWKLAFQHPVTRRKLEFVSPPGPEFDEAVPGAFGKP